MLGNSERKPKTMSKKWDSTMDNNTIIHMKQQKTRQIKLIDESIDVLKLSTFLSQIKYFQIIIANIEKQPE